MKLNSISRINKNKLIDFSSRSCSLNHNSFIKFLIRDRINIDIKAKFTHSNNGAPRYKECLSSLKSYKMYKGGL